MTMHTIGSIGSIGTTTTHWRQYARCLGADPDIFYPPSESDEGSAAAKAVCSICPVREACLEHAITFREKQGVWGGLRAGTPPSDPPTSQDGLSTPAAAPGGRP
jgi:WhiB family redox-sensing transcriptional regulator